MSFRRVGEEMGRTLDFLRALGWEEVYLPESDGSGKPTVGKGQEKPSVPMPRAPAPGSPGRAPAASPQIVSLAEARAEKLRELAQEAASCTRCPLAEGRRNVVFGSGDPDAELMFVGEGPGETEDRKGLPFVGRAGELLTKIIQAIGRTRDEVYIANIVKCRPPGNRDPLSDEVAACMPYLERQIQLVSPRVVVALGRVAAQTLLGNDLPIGRMRGQWYDLRGVPVLVTYHPAALLRNAALKRPTWEDMQAVRDRLAAAKGG